MSAHFSRLPVSVARLFAACSKTWQGTGASVAEVPLACEGICSSRLPLSKRPALQAVVGARFSTSRVEGKAQGTLWHSYLKLLESRPVLSRAVTCAALNAVGDVFCQFVVEGYSELNWKRLSIFTMLGLLYVGPILFYWYSFLGKLFPLGTGVTGVISSVSMDQVLFAPLIIGSFMAILTATSAASLSTVQSKLERDLLPALQVNWMLWVPAQFINFTYVPPSLRVLFCNVVALGWNVYLSHASHK